jgi:hypothetical protein
LKKSRKMRRRPLAWLLIPVCLSISFSSTLTQRRLDNACIHGDNCCFGHKCPNGNTCYFLRQGKCYFKGRKWFSNVTRRLELIVRCVVFQATCTNPSKRRKLPKHLRRLVGRSLYVDGLYHISYTETTIDSRTNPPVANSSLPPRICSATLYIFSLHVRVAGSE